MSIVSTMTTEQLLAIQEDGIERELIRGELRERPKTRFGVEGDSECRLSLRESCV